MANITQIREQSITMDINTETDLSADLKIGPTTTGMVRLFVSADAFKVPLDFSPEEADEIASEIKVAAAKAREIGDM